MLTPSNLIAYSAILNILCAFEKTGVFIELRKNKQGISAPTLAQQLSLQISVLEPLCDFLVINAPEILRKKNENYILGDLFDTIPMQNNLFFSLAYEPVLTNLTGLLNGEMRYGKDILRKGKYLRQSSALYNNIAWDAIIDILRKMEINTIVDLGCSAGDFLTHVHNAFPRIHGIGIEIDNEVVELANKILAEKKLKHHISIKKGDITRPQIWKDDVMKHKEPQHTMFIGITVWHEFLYKGEEYLCNILSQYRSYFPGSFFIVVEYNGIPLEDFKNLPEEFRESASVYQLVHPLTLQGLPQPPQRWQTILKKSGIHIHKTISVNPNSTIYIGIL